MKRILSIILITMLSVLVFAGCGESSSQTLEDYANNDADFKAQLEQAVATPGIDMEIKGNSVVCTYTMDIALDDETLKTYQKSLDESVSESLGKQMPDYAKSIEKETGIKGVTVEVKYVDNKGNVMFDKVYDSKGETE